MGNDHQGYEYFQGTLDYYSPMKVAIDSRDFLPGREYAELAAQGLSNKQIGLHLSLSEHTIKFHISSLYAKMGVANRTEAVRAGVRPDWSFFETSS